MNAKWESLNSKDLAAEVARRKLWLVIASRAAERRASSRSRIALGIAALKERYDFG